MAQSEKLKSTKRFGTRYGRTLKVRLDKIEAISKQKHKCPYCLKAGVKRVSLGIWHCKKWNSKFSGKAFTLSDVVSSAKVSPVATESKDKISLQDENVGINSEETQ